MSVVNFSITKPLEEKINKTIKDQGFTSKAEFFRFAAVDFIRNDARFLPADDTLKDHAKAIRSVEARKNLDSIRKTWNRRGKMTS